MLARGSGHLVGISSVAAFKGLPTAAAYCASKAGLSAYLESLRISLRSKNIAVTTICPGFVRTEMTAKNEQMMWVLDARRGRPEDGHGHRAAAEGVLLPEADAGADVADEVGPGLGDGPGGAGGGSGATRSFRAIISFCAREDTPGQPEPESLRKVRVFDVGSNSSAGNILLRAMCRPDNKPAGTPHRWGKMGLAVTSAALSVFRFASRRRRGRTARKCARHGTDLSRRPPYSLDGRVPDLRSYDHGQSNRNVPLLTGRVAAMLRSRHDVLAGPGRPPGRGGNEDVNV